LMKAQHYLAKLLEVEAKAFNRYEVDS
jgi:hypothetical protein